MKEIFVSHDSVKEVLYEAHDSTVAGHIWFVKNWDKWKITSCATRAATCKNMSTAVKVDRRKMERIRI